MGGGGGGGSGPTLQQQQLETRQALDNANLNLQENEQRKSILNAMQGTRVFRGSALSRAVAGNTNAAPAAMPAPSNAQMNAFGQVIAPVSSLLDTGAGKTASGAAGTGGGGRAAGGGGRGGGPGK